MPRAKPKPALSLLVAVNCLGAVVLLGACGGPTSVPDSRSPRAKVIEVVPGPAAIVSAGAPLPSAAGASPSATNMWVLAGTTQVKAINEMDLAARRVVKSVGVSADASAIAQSPSGTIALGLATASTGAVELLDPSTGAATSTLAMGAPVHSLAFGADGVTLYVLNGTSTSTSVTVVDTSHHTIVSSLGASSDAVGIVPSPSQTDLWTVQRAGDVEQLSLETDRSLQDLDLRSAGIALAISPDGQKLYVLKGDGQVDNISVIDLLSGLVVSVLSAAANSIGLSISQDGHTLYDVVGAPTFGNVQVISLASIR